MRKQQQHMSTSELGDVLTRAASDPTSGYEVFAYEDLPRYKNAPKDWEQVVIECSSLKSVVQPEYFLAACAEFLINNRCSWEGLEGLISRTLDLQSSYVFLESICKYAKGRQVSIELARKIVHTIERKPPFIRFLYFLDSPIRSLVKDCRTFVETKKQISE